MIYWSERVGMAEACRQRRARDHTGWAYIQRSIAQRAYLLMKLKNDGVETWKPLKYK
jgi:hypothetical protein